MDYTDLVLLDRISKKFADLGIDGRIDLLLMHYADKKYKSSITDEQKEILEYIFSGYYPRLVEDEGQSHIEDILERQHHEEHNYKSETLSIMVEEKLVTTYEKLGCVAYTPTALGHRINEHGGWRKHVKRLERDKSLVSMASRTSIIVGATTLLIISATAFFALQDKNIHEEELKMQQKIFLQDSIQLKTQQEIGELYQRKMDSTFQEMDNLRNELFLIKNESVTKKK